MNIALLTGRGGSQSIKNKNIYPILGKPLMVYPILAAKRARKLDRIYITTDSPEMQAIAREHGVSVIDRPAEISQPDSEMTDAIVHALDQIPEPVDILVTMHCNCGTHREGLIDDCIQALEDNPEADSCVSGVIDNSHHPFRVKKVLPDGYLETWLDVPRSTSNNRQQLTPSFVLDGACRAIRVDRCFPAEGQPPFPYLGNKILHMENEGCCDVHSMQDIVYTEYYLRQKLEREAAE